jgi:FemAB-related protein (PEP-CTERM system-associated)
MVRENLVCKIAEADDASEWDEFVRSHNEASGYHLWSWQMVFRAAFGHRCHYLIAKRGNGVVGVLPLVEVRSWLFGRALSSLPYVNYGGILADDLETSRVLLEHAAELMRARSLSYVLLRHRRRLLPELRARTHKVAMLMPLQRNRDDMWERLDRKVRNQIRKAEKSGLAVASGGVELLEEFYAVFARNMRDLGTPTYGKALFSAILSQFPQDARLHVARLEGRPIASALSYTYGDGIEVPSASSLREHRALCPNHLLYWSVIVQAIDDGRRAFDFGRSTLDDGTYHFKKQWGAVPEQLWWEYSLRDGVDLPSDDRQDRRFRGPIEMWKRLPVGLATFFGPVIANSVP